MQNQERICALREGRKPRQRPKNPAIFKIPFRRPKAIGEARANMTEALSLLRGCGLALPQANFSKVTCIVSFVVNIPGHGLLRI